MRVAGTGRELREKIKRELRRKLRPFRALAVFRPQAALKSAFIKLSVIKLTESLRSVKLISDQALIFKNSFQLIRS
ncbi:MAG: hypothetical protein C5B49_10340 [Bdellovibrio sp.]|nr:MAG: hypothetical protein C5B49_10340 [Bdellovibrio sp.]